MTKDEGITLNRMVGRLEEAVTALQQSDLTRAKECQRHWGVTNSITQSLATEAAIEAHAAVARKTLADAAGVAVAKINMAAEKKLAQHHWLIERAQQFAYPITAVGLLYLVQRLFGN
jgi:hypothetical protein